MGNLIRMDLYRMFKGKTFRICLIIAFIIAAGGTPVAKLLASLGQQIANMAGEVIEGIGNLFPPTADLAGIIGSPFSSIILVPVFLSIVSFFYADMEGGYIKNIAGQMPMRGFAILSRYMASIVHNAVFMLVCLAGSLLGTALVQKIVAESSILTGVVSFLLKLLLMQSVTAILLLLAATLRSKSLGVVAAVLFGIGATMLLYAAIETGLGQLFRNTVSISPYMPDMLLKYENPEPLRSIIVSAVVIGIFLPLSIRLFDRKDVK